MCRVIFACRMPLYTMPSVYSTTSFISTYTIYIYIGKYIQIELLAGGVIFIYCTLCTLYVYHSFTQSTYLMMMVHICYIYLYNHSILIIIHRNRQIQIFDYWNFSFCNRTYKFWCLNFPNILSLKCINIMYII